MTRDRDNRIIFSDIGVHLHIGGHHLYSTRSAWQDAIKRALTKLVVFDGVGFWLCYRRLERGRWVWPKAGERVMTLSYPQFLLLVQGQDWRQVKAPEKFRPSLI